MCGACSKNNNVISVRIYDTGYGLKQLKLLFFGGLGRLSLELNQIIINHGFQAHFIRAIKFKLPKNPVHASGRDFYFLLLTSSLLPQKSLGLWEVISKK